MSAEFFERIDFTKLYFLRIHREIKMLHLCGIALNNVIL